MTTPKETPEPEPGSAPERVIQPTFHCFDDVVHLIAARVRQQPALVFGDALIIVHAIALGTTNEPYTHAWIEEADRCWDAGLLDGERVYYTLPRAQFYRSRRVQQTTRYTILEAAAAEAASGHYGPWEPAYIALAAAASRRAVGLLEHILTDDRSATP